jgi:Base plate wedge protein 53
MTDAFTPNSRYYGLPLRTRVNPDGTSDNFVGRRVIPALSRYRALDRYRVVGEERIDAVAAEVFGDPELYWRICDANGDADPGRAAQPTGRLLVIPLPLEIADDGDA